MLAHFAFIIATAAAAGNATKPNIIWVMADDMVRG